MRVESTPGRRRTASLLLTVLMVAMSAACDEGSSTTSEEDDDDDDDLVTVVETFSGTFGQDEGVRHIFTVTEEDDNGIGEAEIELTAIGPLETITIGIGIGDEDPDEDFGCLLRGQDEVVQLGDRLAASSIEAGTYCVVVYDVGNVAPGNTVTYTIEVEHS